MVFLLDIEKYHPSRDSEHLKRNRVFVGITRAMNLLYVLYVKDNNPSKFIKEIIEIDSIKDH